MPAAKTRKRRASVVVLKSVESAVGSLASDGSPSFNAILGRLKSEGVLANHRSLRTYLDLLLASGSLRMGTARSAANIRPMQVYSLTGRGPFVRAGEGAMSLHGLAWDTGVDETKSVRLDLEGVARGTLESGTLYASVEDTVVAALESAGGAEAKALALTYCAALLASNRLDEDYLLRRAEEAGVAAEVEELLDELRSIFYAPRTPVMDVKTLYRVRGAFPPLRRGSMSGDPRWTLFDPDGLLDVVGKQLGVK